MREETKKVALILFIMLVTFIGAALVLRKPTEEFRTATKVEGGCNYVVVRSVDGVAVTPALNQPETCYVELIKVN